MIESPLIQELLAEEKHGDILRVLTDRFGAVPPAVKTSLQSIQDVEKLRGLMVWASRCPDLEAFHSRLSA